MLAKVAEYLAAGTQRVWVIDPPRAVAIIYRDDGSVDTVTADDVLSGETVLPGFTVPLREILSLT
jgi:Uma2 family endonuclease